MIEPSRGTDLFISAWLKCLRLALFEFVPKGYLSRFAQLYRAAGRLGLPSALPIGICFPEMLLFPFVSDATRLLWEAFEVQVLWCGQTPETNNHSTGR